MTHKFQRDEGDRVWTKQGQKLEKVSHFQVESSSLKGRFSPNPLDTTGKGNEQNYQIFNSLVSKTNEFSIMLKSSQAKPITHRALIACHHLWPSLGSFLKAQVKPKPNPTPQNMSCIEPEAFEGKLLYTTTSRHKTLT